MEYLGCKPIVDEVIEEFSEKIGSNYIINEEVQDRLHICCSLVDKIVPELECQMVEASVNIDSTEFTISIICDEIVLENETSHIFFDLIELVDAFSFSKYGGEYLRIALNFDGLWEDASE